MDWAISVGSPPYFSGWDMRLLVCGGRDYADKAHVWGELDRELAADPNLVICVGYDPEDPRFQGADQLAYEWAKARGVRGSAFPAHWKAHGRSAGPKRNRRMFAAFSPDRIKFFPGGRGTADMCSVGLAAGIPVEPASSLPTSAPQRLAYQPER